MEPFSRLIYSSSVFYDTTFTLLPVFFTYNMMMMMMMWSLMRVELSCKNKEHNIDTLFLVRLVTPSLPLFTSHEMNSSPAGKYCTCNR